MPSKIEQEVAEISAALTAAGVTEVIVRKGLKSVDWQIKSKYRAGYRPAGCKSEVRKRLAPFNLDHLVSTQHAGRISHV